MTAGENNWEVTTFERDESERQCPIFSLWVLVSPLLTYTPFVFLSWYFHIRDLIGNPDLSQMSHLVIPLGIVHSWIISWKECPVLSFPHRCQILVLKRYKEEQVAEESRYDTGSAFLRNFINHSETHGNKAIIIYCFISHDCISLSFINKLEAPYYLNLSHLVTVKTRVHVNHILAIFLLWHYLHWKISKKRNVVISVCIFDQVLILKLILNYQNLSSIWLKQADICQLFVDSLRNGIMEIIHSKFVRSYITLVQSTSW